MLSSYHKVVEYTTVFVFLWILLQLYFKMADRHNIIDKPNNRSSHNRPTVRGGGIIVIMAVVGWFILYDFPLPWFVLGSLLIATISFADDIKPQRAALRFGIHLIAFALLLYQIPILSPWWLVVIVCVLGIGALNAFNFMDGINGITGIYALVNLLTLLCIDKLIVKFVEEELIIFVMLSVLVFMIYNFRTTARCFAGDVGSIVLAYVQIFLVMKLVHTTGNYSWVLFFLVYGIDAVATITYRLFNKENIFKAHRTHLYQYLANEYGYSHLRVSILYGLLQAVVNILIIVYLQMASWWSVFLLIAGMTILYIILRERLLLKIGKEGVVYKMINRT